MKVKTKIELTEKDLAEIVAEKFKLTNATINIYQYQADSRDLREQSYTTITVEGEQN